MSVSGDGIPGLAAQQLIKRHIGKLTFNIPQRHIHAGYGVIHYGAISPVGIDVHHLPEIFNIVGVTAD